MQNCGYLLLSSRNLAQSPRSVQAVPMELPKKDFEPNDLNAEAERHLPLTREEKVALRNAWWEQIHSVAERSMGEYGSDPAEGG